MHFSSKLPIIIVLGLVALTGCSKKKFKPKNLRPIKAEYAQYKEQQGDLELRVKQLRTSELRRCFRWHVRKKMEDFAVIQMTIINNGTHLYAVDKKKTDVEDLSADEVYKHVKYKWYHYIVPVLGATTVSTALYAGAFALSPYFSWGNIGILAGITGFTNILSAPYAKSRTNRHVRKQLHHVHFTSDTLIKPKDVCNVLFFFPIAVPMKFAVGLKNRKVEDDRLVFAVNLATEEEHTAEVVQVNS